MIIKIKDFVFTKLRWWLAAFLSIIGLAGHRLLSAAPVTTFPSTYRISTDTSGTQGNSHSGSPAISADGKWVAFSSSATNLVSGDTNGYNDLFVRNYELNTIERVSVTTAGTQFDHLSYGNASISADGRYVAFMSSTNSLGYSYMNSKKHIYIRDRLLGKTTVADTSASGTVANGWESSGPTLTPDGRYLLFTSDGSNLVSGDTNGARDTFLKDLWTGAIERVSIADDESQANSGSGNNSDRMSDMSSDARYISFSSTASNLVSGDTNSKNDVFVRDRQAGTTIRVSVSTSGAEGTNDSDFNSISDDGQIVVFRTFAPLDGVNNPGTYYRNLSTSTTTRMSNNGKAPDINANGTVASYGISNNAAVFNLSTSTQTLLNSGANNSSDNAVISASGQTVAYSSQASNIVSGDTNASNDVFVYYGAQEDIVAPTVSGTPDRSANANGWYDASVVIDWSSTDASPSSGTPTDPTNTTANTEGVVSYKSNPSCDPAGNCAVGTLSLSIDTSDPVITFHGNNGTYAASDIVSITCAAHDEVSGIDDATCENGSGFAYEYLGGHTFNASATDNAGNTTTNSTTITAVTVTQTDMNRIIDIFLNHLGKANDLKRTVELVSTTSGGTKTANVATFKNEVNAFESAGVLTTQQADALEDLIDLL